MSKLIVVLTILYALTCRVEAAGLSAEVRLFDGAEEFSLTYKNFSAAWLGDDFTKLTFKREIISLMDTGLDFNVSANVAGGAVLPSAGVKLYARVRPRLELSLQMSGLTLGGRIHTTDFESCLRYYPRKNFSISAGWRGIGFKFLRDKFNRRGLFAGVRCDF